MSNITARVNSVLMPTLGVLSTGALIGIFFELDALLSNGAQLAQWAKNHNSCVYMAINSQKSSGMVSNKKFNLAKAVRYCNGGR